MPFPCPVVERYFPAEPDPGSLGTVRDGLRAWEKLTVRMARNWPPLGWYGASLYAMDLDFRDEAADLLPVLTGSDHDAARMVRDLLDVTYRDLTVDDGGAALSAAGLIAAGNIACTPWYWRRRPRSLPW